MTPTILSQPYRPFFPLTALYAAASIMVWLAGLSSMLPLPSQPTLWHAHEMLFGFAAAIIVGFVLTAAGNWTGLKVTAPWELAVLAGLWTLARIAALVPEAVHHPLSASIDGLFLPVAALLMTRVLLRSGNRRNYMFIPFLWGLALINIGYHLSLLQGQIERARLLITLTAWLVGFLMIFMGGRVIPFFTANRCQYKPTQWPWLNWLSTLAALLAGVLLVALPLTVWSSIAAAVAGLAALLRLLLWRPWRVWREPMLWILHLGYAWLAVAFLLAAAVHAGWLRPLTLPIHALMAGALGCLGLGMMTRVALGHSGRPIEASLPMQAAFIMVIIAGGLRIASYGPWAWSGLPSLTLSAMFWALAFLAYFLIFAPLLWRKA